MPAPVRLAIAALLCALLLAGLHALTRGEITNNERAFAERLLLQVVPDASHIEASPDGGHILFRDGTRLGTLRRVETQAGYNGLIAFWLAISDGGEVLGVRVIRHNETPGIGDPIDAAVSDWCDNFNGRSLANSNWSTTRRETDFDMISGATITSRAMINAVHDALEERP